MSADQPGQVTAGAAFQQHVHDAVRDLMASDVSSPGAERVWQKRLRQITHHGYTPEHDATHEPGQFAAAAVALAEWATVWREGTDPHLCYGEVHKDWPWDRASWNRATETLEETLTNAAALLVAELDQLLAATPPTAVQGDG